MNYSFYQIRTLSNLHVGSGQASYGIVDNVVQRDILNQHPCIHSTSLKGALKQLVEKNNAEDAKEIFGDANEKTAKKETGNKQNKPGTHYFFQAFLLSYPFRSNKRPYFNVTTRCILKNLKELLDLYKIDTFKNEIESLIKIKPEVKNPVSLENFSDAIIETHDIRLVHATADFPVEGIKTLLGDYPVIMHPDDFSKLIRKLPVIARNHLENGQSTNLFYEEVVPRETRFGFFTGCESAVKARIETHLKNNEPVQIGANATVGYGQCIINKMN